MVVWVAVLRDPGSFGWTYHYHPQGRRLNETSNQQKQAANEAGLISFLFALLSDTDDEGVVFLRNVGLPSDYTELQPRSHRIVEHEIHLSKVKNVSQSPWLQIRRPRVRFRALKEKSSWSGTGSTQPREYKWPPLWSSGQSSWLQIRRSWIRFPGTTRKKILGLEGGPLSVLSTTEELLGSNSSGSGLESQEYGRRDSPRWPRSALYPQKSWH
jgi:hypothetical protein